MLHQHTAALQDQRWPPELPEAVMAAHERDH
jgi:hypothetical protein